MRSQNHCFLIYFVEFRHTHVSQNVIEIKFSKITISFVFKSSENYGTHLVYQNLYLYRVLKKLHFGIFKNKTISIEILILHLQYFLLKTSAFS